MSKMYQRKGQPNTGRWVYLSCDELFESLHRHASPQDSSHRGEAWVIPGGGQEKNDVDKGRRQKKHGEFN